MTVSGQHQMPRSVMRPYRYEVIPSWIQSPRLQVLGALGRRSSIHMLAKRSMRSKRPARHGVMPFDDLSPGWWLAKHD
jgi:hypothetical protein